MSGCRSAKVLLFASSTTTRDVECRQVLLVLEFSIDRQERVEASGNRDA